MPANYNQFASGIDPANTSGLGNQTNGTFIKFIIFGLNTISSFQILVYSRVFFERFLSRILVMTTIMVYVVYGKACKDRNKHTGGTCMIKGCFKVIRIIRH